LFFFLIKRTKKSRLDPLALDSSLDRGRISNSPPRRLKQEIPLFAVKLLIPGELAAQVYHFFPGAWNLSTPLKTGVERGTDLVTIA
jgi:hypothetical protein